MIKPRPIHYDKQWRMEDELTFIDGIGKSVDSEVTNRQGEASHLYPEWSREFLLKMYLRVCVKRSDWGVMKKDEAVEYARVALQNC